MAGMKPLPPVFWSAPRVGAPPIRYARRALERPRNQAAGYDPLGPGYSQADPNAFPQEISYSERLIFGRGDTINLASSGMQAAAVTAEARTETPQEKTRK